MAGGGRCDGVALNPAIRMTLGVRVSEEECLATSTVHDIVGRAGDRRPGGRSWELQRRVWRFMCSWIIALGSAGKRVRLWVGW